MLILDWRRRRKRNRSSSWSSIGGGVAIERGAAAGIRSVAALASTEDQLVVFERRLRRQRKRSSGCSLSGGNERFAAVDLELALH
ncbi:hypothetical protein LINPERHAP1_LOCUS27163 [Linum perenne]